MEHERHLRHPSNQELASFWNGTSSSETLERVAAHVDGCEMCETRLEALQPGFSKYRQCLELVHKQVGRSRRPEEDLWKKMDRIDARRPRARLVVLRPAWLSGIAAAAACAALLVLPRLGESELRAETLLRLAAAAPAPRHSTVRLQVKTRRLSFERPLAPTSEMPGKREEEALRARFTEAHYNWDDPLSPKSYSDWWHGLKHKKSKVSQPHNPAGETRQTIETRTDDGALRDAELTLDEKLLPVSASFRFADEESVEITAVPADSNAGSVSTPSPSPPSTPLPPPAMPRPSAPADSVAERELDVWLAIDALHTGAGEPIEVSAQQSGHILVTTYGLAPELEAGLRASLDRIPDVTLRPAIAADKPQPRPAEDAQPADRTIRASQDILFEAHLLLELASRFEASTEAGLNPSSKAQLCDLRMKHAVELQRNLARLLRELEQQHPDFRLAPAAAADQPPVQAIAWSAAVVDRLVIGIYAGSEPEARQSADWRQLGTELGRLQGLAGSYTQDVEPCRKELP
jgi:hypothetical protein